MRAFPAFAVACVAIGFSSFGVFLETEAAANCTETHVVSAESETLWTVTCGSATTPLVSFNPALLKEFNLDGKTSQGVTLDPPSAPQPEKVTLPRDVVVQFKALKSSKVTKLEIDAEIDRPKTVDFAANTFAGLLKLETLRLSGYNFTQPATPFVVPASLNELDLLQVGVDNFDAKVEGGALNTSVIEFTSCKLKELPSIIFHAPDIFRVDFYMTFFPPLTLSRKRYARLLELLDGKMQSGGLAKLIAENYEGDCAGGTKETITGAQSSPILVCVMPTGTDDALVAMETQAPPTKTMPEPTMSKAEKKELEKLIGKVDSSAVARVGAVVPAATIVALVLATVVA